MRINLTDKLIGLDGKQIADRDSGALLTVGWLAGQVLVGMLEDGNVGQKEKQRRFLLAVRIAKGDIGFDIEVEDVALLKRLVDKMYPAPLVSGQFAALVDPAVAEAATVADAPALNGSGAHIN